MTLELESYKDPGTLPTTDTSHPRSSFVSLDKGSSPQKMQSYDAPTHPRSLSSASSPQHSFDKGSDSTDKGLNDAYNTKVRLPPNSHSPRPYSSSLQLPHESSSLHPSNSSSTPPPRPPRSSSTSAPSHSPSSPDSSHDSKTLRVSPDSCLYSASPTPSSLPPYSPHGDEEQGEERVAVEAGRRDERYER